MRYWLNEGSKKRDYRADEVKLTKQELKAVGRWACRYATQNSVGCSKFVCGCAAAPIIHSQRYMHVAGLLPACIITLSFQWYIIKQHIRIFTLTFGTTQLHHNSLFQTILNPAQLIMPIQQKINANWMILPQYVPPE